MTAIRNLISVWALAFLGSLLLPLVGVMAASSAMYDLPGATTMAPVSPSGYATIDCFFGVSPQITN